MKLIDRFKKLSKREKRQMLFGSIFAYFGILSVSAGIGFDRFSKAIAITCIIASLLLLAKLFHDVKYKDSSRLKILLLAAPILPLLLTGLFVFLAQLNEINTLVGLLGIFAGGFFIGIIANLVICVAGYIIITMIMGF
jgi:hypothetical protein